MSFKLLITGDFAPIHRIDSEIRNGKSVKYFFNYLLPIIEDCDYAITNLECPISHQLLKPIEKTGPILNGNPESLKILKDAGFQLVTLANNHIMDFGSSGLNSTIEYLKNFGIDHIGAGLIGGEAEKTKKLLINGKNLSILNFAENEWSTTDGELAGAHGIDPVKNSYKISEARSKSDFVLVITHGGHEMYNLPSPRIKQLYRFYIDCGADAVINHHPHIVSGYEEHHGKPIYYSLGNFLFDNEKLRDTSWNEGMAVVINFDSSGVKHRRIPFSQCNVQPHLKLYNTHDAKNFESNISELNTVIESDELLSTAFNKFCKSKRKIFDGYIEPYSNRYLNFLRNRNLFPKLYSKRKKKYLLNLTRCESHREILIKYLKNSIHND